MREGTKVSEKHRTREDIVAALRHSWFPVARVQDLGRPVAATLLNENLVAYRTQAGEARVLQSRCSHRGANLAKGEVHGDRIACPYHGWQYNGETGRCEEVPSLDLATGKIPPQARVRSYPAVEQWGHVWTCLDEPLLGMPDPSEFNELELGEWLAGPPLECSIGLVATTENFRDVAHFPFVHRGTMGEVAPRVEPLDVRREGMEVWMTRRVLAQPGAAWSQDGDSWMRYHTIAPGVSIILYDYDTIGKRVLVGSPSPKSATECTIFWSVANDSGFKGMTVSGAMEAEYAVYLEDVPVISDLDPREVPFDGETFQVSVPSDRFTLQYRRAFLEFVDRTFVQSGADANGSQAPATAGVDEGHA
jgi:phenylpropionate dioxygenase-like ring-hydroxylating dioxygenase large terminal subunit